MNTQVPVVSVVMPCLNEAQGVGPCVTQALQALAEMGVPGEVVVVDNGSTDDSAQVAEAAGALVVKEPRRGYGSAYLKGFQEARGKILVMGDADGTYPFGDLAHFVQPLLDGKCDMIMGSRLKGRILPGAMPWTHRWIGNPILSGMLKLFFKTSISDSHCGMRSFTRDAYTKMRLQTTGMEFASEVVVNALRANLKIQEIPISYHPRVGDSKLEGISDAWRHVRFMLLYSPSYLFLLPGLVLMALGIALVGALSGGPREIFGRVWDYHPFLLGSFFILLSFNLILFDVIAKTFSMRAGLAVENRWLARLTSAFRLERGLFLGAILTLCGALLEIKIGYDWMQSGFGEMMAVKGIVLGMTAIVLGAETAFASFLISLLMIEYRRA